MEWTGWKIVFEHEKEAIEMEQKTQAQLQQELMEKLAAQNGQYMQEVAMPGVVMLVVQNDK